MNISVNGMQMSWGLVAAVIVAVFGYGVGYGVLQFQVTDNTEGIIENKEAIEKHEDIAAHPNAAQQLAVLSTTQKNIQDNMRKMEAHAKAQTELLNEAVRQLATIAAQQ